MSTQQNHVTDKANKRKLEAVKIYHTKEQGLSIRALAEQLSMSVGGVHKKVKEGQAAFAADPSLTLEACETGLIALEMKATGPAPKRPVNEKAQAAVEAILPIATSSAGISARTEYELLCEAYGQGGWDSAAKSYVRKRVRTLALGQGKKALFVPDWINPRIPNACISEMCLKADELHRRIEEMVGEYMADMDIGPEGAYGVRQALLGMAVPGYGKRDVMEICDEAQAVAQQLTQNGVSTENSDIY